MTGRPARAALAPLAMSLALAAMPVQASPPAAKALLSPPFPEAGGAFTLTILAEGVPAGGLDIENAPEPEGIALIAKTVRPRLFPSGPGAELRLEYRSSRAGTWNIGPFALVGSGLGVTAPAIVLQVRLPGGAEPPPAWEWAAPPRIARWATFSASLRPVEGLAPPEASAEASAPAGAAFDAAGRLSWLVTALEGGEIVLPATAVGLGRGKPAGSAVAQRIEVVEMPGGAASSRAAGEFKLSLEGRDLGAGKALVSLILSGHGNFPFLHPPAPAISLNGIELGDASLRSRRVEDWKPTSEGYVGRMVIEAECSLPSSGRLTAGVEAWPYLSADGTVRSLTAPSLTLVIPGFGAPASEPSRPEGPFGSPESLDRPGMSTSSRAAYAQAATAWHAGEKGRALALLYGALRVEPGSIALARAAQSFYSELGSGPPLLDALPDPRLFAVGAAFLLAAALTLSWLRGRRHIRPGLWSIILALALGLVAAAFSLTSALERRDSFAVIWSDHVLLVPSPAAEGSVGLPRGSTALVRGGAPGYVGVKLADGLSGWVPREDVYFY